MFGDSDKERKWPIAKDKVMKITDVKLLVLEDPEAKGSGGHSIVRVEGLRRIQYTH